MKGMRGLLRVAAFAILLLAAAGCDGLTTSTGTGTPGSTTIGSGPGPDPAWTQALSGFAAPWSAIAVNSQGQAFAAVSTFGPNDTTYNNMRADVINAAGGAPQRVPFSLAGSPRAVYAGRATNGNAWVVVHNHINGGDRASVRLVTPTSVQWSTTIAPSCCNVNVEDGAVDPQGNLYVLGETSADFGTNPNNDPTLFVQKYAPSSSTAVWTTQYPVPALNTFSNVPLQLAYEPQGGGYLLAAAFTWPDGNPDHGVMPVVQVLSPAGKLVGSPTDLFSQPSTTDRFNDMAAAPNGDIYLAGAYQAPNRVDSDFLLVRFDYQKFMAGQASYLSAYTDGSTADDQAFALAVAPSGTLYVAGNTDADSYGFGFWANQHGRGDAVLAAYTADSSGIHRKWVTMFNAGFQDGIPTLEGITIDSTHGVYVIGEDIWIAANDPTPTHDYPNFVTRFAITP